MPSAYVAEDHESRRAFAPALEDVWAASFLTNGVQAQVLDQIIYAVEPFIRANSYLQPVGPRAGEFRFSHSYLGAQASLPALFVALLRKPREQAGMPALPGTLIGANP